MTLNLYTNGGNDIACNTVSLYYTDVNCRAKKVGCCDAGQKCHGNCWPPDDCWTVTCTNGTGTVCDKQLNTGFKICISVTASFNYRQGSAIAVGISF